jgi:hypothetical protein
MMMHYLLDLEDIKTIRRATTTGTSANTVSIGKLRPPRNPIRKPTEK